MTGPAIHTAAELDRLDLPPSRYVARLGNVRLAAGSRTLVHGPPGVSKTLLVLRAALEAALSGYRAIVYQGEGSLGAFRDRARRLLAGLGPTRPLGALGDRLLIVHGALNLQEASEAWHGLLEAKAPAVVVVDPMTAYFRGNENDSGEVGKFLRALDLACLGDASLTLVHHDTKPNQEGRSRERGSGAISAWADTVVGVALMGGQVVVNHEKEREGERGEPQRLDWDFGPGSIRLLGGE